MTRPEPPTVTLFASRRSRTRGLDQIDGSAQLVRVDSLNEVDPGEVPAVLLLDRSLFPEGDATPVVRALPPEVAVVSLDGTGYPRGVAEPEIPIQTRIMTVSDIFDALTASDRPYKKALDSDRAISILEMEADGGQLDRAVVDLMIESGVYRRVLEEDWRQF